MTSISLSEFINHERAYIGILPLSVGKTLIVSRYCRERVLHIQSRQKYRMLCYIYIFPNYVRLTIFRINHLN